MSTSGLATIVPLLEGEIYVLTLNICTDIGLAKSIDCRLIKIHWDTATSQPAFLEMEFVNLESASLETFPGIKRIPGHPNTRRFILPRQTAPKPIEYTILNEKGAFEVRKCHRSQFPIVSNLSFTLFKVQGKTIPDFVSSIAGLTPQELYLVFSRVRGWDHILLIDDFEYTASDFEHSWPADILHERERVRLLAERTENGPIGSNGRSGACFQKV